MQTGHFGLPPNDPWAKAKATAMSSLRSILDYNWGQVKARVTDITIKDKQAVLQVSLVETQQTTFPHTRAHVRLFDDQPREHTIAKYKVTIDAQGKIMNCTKN